jgi:hypothetical protein
MVVMSVFPMGPNRGMMPIQLNNNQQPVMVTPLNQANGTNMGQQCWNWGNLGDTAMQGLAFAMPMFFPAGPMISGANTAMSGSNPNSIMTGPTIMGTESSSANNQNQVQQPRNSLFWNIMEAVGNVIGLFRSFARMSGTA